jgi:DNA repair photolyase
VVRDTDILQEISKTYAAVSFTNTAADDILSKKIETHAPLTSERFRAMKYLAKAGIYTGVTLMPLLPFINDTAENLTTIIKMAKDSGASYVLPMFGVTMRNGSREYFYNELDKQFPTIKEKYQANFAEKYECFSPNYRILTNIFQKLTADFGIETKVRFYQPKTYFQQSIF